mgnify:CR=1 FL=1
MTKELILPSGKIATVKPGKGYDLLQAQQKAKSSEEIPYALIAELCEIDGQKLVHEDILELDLADVITLQAEISGKFQAVSQQVNQSSIYAEQQDGSIQNSEECPSEN